MWPTLFALTATALVAALLACVWLWSRSGALRSDRDRLADELRHAQSQRDRLSEENRDLLRQLERTQAAREEAEKQFARAQEQARQAFQNLAGSALKDASEQFLSMARRSLESEHKDAVAQLEQRKQAIEALVKPVRETLEKYNTSIQQIEAARKEAYGGLREQLNALVADQRRLREETASLVTALRRPEGRGRWGEMQLKRVAELAGMIENCDFYEQGSIDTEDGRLRPDMVVKLPGDRTIVVDAKTPCDAFINAVQATDDEQRERYLDQHVSQIEQQVQSLARKGYQSQFERTPDFVVMFIPGESFLQAAVQRKPDLLESAMNRGVVIATPSTLIALLKAVAIGWREERIADNARRISELGRELHERIATAVGHVEMLGKHLDNAVKSYNMFLGSLESRVLVTARKFKELGADSPKELPADARSSQIETTPREMRSTADDTA